ncbi:FAD-binding and (Fe-S)-binding domain-containing protein [Ornithinimicrobium tianjinense]|uniref:D-lactate dehydrogenase (cytochrome) n=1 Tax=Ornithinimicrobium tianjinense TaxID=1195761 RepID=A0A917F247_9MICO|nr:FAD-binding and (Fe-S)-binding domain-containing protein [Ornithinimicrobium tianjinense]GGF40888.1 oxidoreductase [Ornithinimicrobium tianjinense]
MTGRIEGQRAEVTGHGARAVVTELERELGADRVSTRALDRHALAHDASHYLLVPAVVARPEDADQVAAVMRACDRAGTPLTFRAGGTSLSGQAVTDGVLVDVRRHFRGMEVLDDGARVRVQPGTTVAAVNARLRPLGRRLGPDPASEFACTVGGVVANNSSGMQCGTELNTYATLESLVAVLPTGVVLDSGLADADERLRHDAPELHAGLLRLRDRVRGDAGSVRTVRRLFALKNTMGYGVNAFLDFDDPAQILAHLMIGSEGTLGFIASATFRTVPVRSQVATGLLLFDDVVRATSAVPRIVEAGTATAELLDAASLRVSALDPLAPAAIRDLDVVDHAALLVEWQDDDAEQLTGTVAQVRRSLADLPVSSPWTLTQDPGERAALWRARKALYSAVAGARPQGTNALLEDVVVAVDRLGETILELTRLFEGHAYEDSVIFGHARDGNVHFMLNEEFDDPARLDRYQAFTEDMVQLVLAAGGSLKAEHGTGRIMAPFVRRQYGDELYEVMWELKRLVDPRGLLNPGAVLSDEPTSYLAHLKTAPRVEEEVDRCVECGFCEPVCPSRDLTTTPRQRIVLRRELAAARQRGDEALAAELAEQYEYDGTDTCAVDGMCLTACPVRINTGDLTRRLRAEASGPVGEAAWRTAATVWGAGTTVASAALTASRLAPRVPEALTALARRAADHDAVPAYDRRLPRGGRRRTADRADDAVAVHFAPCVGTMFGPERATGGVGPEQALRTLAARAGMPLRTPEGLAGLCCGTPWKSKGRTSGYAAMAARVLPALWAATEEGRLPVVCEAASCAEGLVQMVGRDPAYAGLRVVDATAWAAEHLLDRLPVTDPVGSVVVHPTCSSTHLGTTDALVAVARHVGGDVSVPVDWGCCGFAGDRGMLHPELTAAATAPEATEVGAKAYDAYVSNNRTCEIGMTRATGQPYQHVLELLERATR